MPHWMLLTLMGVTISLPCIYSMVKVYKTRDFGYFYIGVLLAWLVDICWWFVPAAHSW